MRRSFLGLGKQFCWFLLLPALCIACDDDEDLTPEQTRARAEVAAKDNSRFFAVTQEVLDLTSMALIEKGVSGGREATGSRLNNRLTCYPTISASYDVKKSADSVVYEGVLTIDYEDGSSCEDAASVSRGRITDSFKYVIAFQDSVPFKAVDKITFESFEKDSAKVDGIFISRQASGGSRTVEIDDVVLTYPDGTSASWDGLLTYDYDHGGTPFNPADDTRSLSGNLNGTTREGVDISSSVTEDVLYANQCGRLTDTPVSGVVEISTSGTNAVVDYGDGTCDTAYTITANGETTAYDFEPANL